MASKREQVLAAVAALIEAATAPARFERNPSKPLTPTTDGLVIMRDGDPGEPETTIGVRSYSYKHRIALELAVAGVGEPARRAKLDAIQVQIGDACAADPTLAGLVDFLEPEAPSVDDVNIPGAEPVTWSDLGILADYTTNNPLT